MGVEFGTCSEGSASSATGSRKRVWRLLWPSPAQCSSPLAAPARHYGSQLRMPRRTPARAGHQAQVGIQVWEVSRPGAVPPTADFSSQVAVGPPAPEAAASCAFHRRVSRHRIVATATSSLARTPAIAVDRVAARAGAGPARQHRNLALAGLPSNTGAHLCPALRSAVLHRSHALVGLAQASPTASLRRASPIPSAQTERTAAASPGQAWSRQADVRTTSASPTRIVQRGRPASAAARPRTTARMFVTLAAIAPWTRIAARADIALPRWRPATLQIPKP